MFLFPFFSQSRIDLASCCSKFIVQPAFYSTAALAAFEELLSANGVLDTCCFSIGRCEHRQKARQHWPNAACCNQKLDLLMPQKTIAKPFIPLDMNTTCTASRHKTTAQRTWSPTLEQTATNVLQQGLLATTTETADFTEYYFTDAGAAESSKTIVNTDRRPDSSNRSITPVTTTTMTWQENERKEERNGTCTTRTDEYTAEMYHDNTSPHLRG